MVTVRNENEAPSRSPKVRQKAIMVPARFLSLGLDARSGPIIMHIDATYPFEKAINIMKMIGNASDLNATGS